MRVFDYALLKNPLYFRDGRMDAHSDHIYYKDENELQERETSYRYSLNGLWKFHYAKIIKAVSKDLSPMIILAENGMIFMFLHIFRWKDMIYHSMQIFSIHGKVMRKFIREKFRKIQSGCQLCELLYRAGDNERKTSFHFFPGSRKWNSIMAERDVCRI